VFTTVAGAVIGYVYERQAADSQREASVREARRDAAMTTFRDVARLMDQRLFWGSQYYDALSTDTSTARRRQLAARFDSTIWAWRESFYTNVASVCRFFGPENSRMLTDSIADKFSRLGYGIRQHGRNRELADRNLFPLYDSLRVEILRFNLGLVEMIRTGVAGDAAGGVCVDPSRADTAKSQRAG
jgi:hypothetical protein